MVGAEVGRLVKRYKSSLVSDGNRQNVQIGNLARSQNLGGVKKGLVDERERIGPEPVIG